MINSLMASLRATAMAHRSGGSVQGLNQGRQQLANHAQPNLNFGDTFRLQQTDKAMELGAVQANFNYEMAMAQLEQAQRMQKKNFEQKRQAIQNGWLA